LGVDKDARIYFYDQSSFNQYKLVDDGILAPPGVVIYENERSSFGITSIIDETRGERVGYRTYTLVMP